MIASASMGSSQPRLLGRALTLASVAGALFLFGCDGSASSGSSTPGVGGGGVFPSLVKFETGRLVDIYSYRRVVENNADRRDSRNRMPILIERNAVIGAGIQSDELFDILGNARASANYRFLPFNTVIGHEELMILWDDRNESAQFQAAMDGAKNTLDEVPASWREQNTSIRKIPVIARNAALKLSFDQALPVSAAFFAANPGALQVLEIRDDPNTAGPAAFQPAKFRVLVEGNALIIDTSLIGGEVSAGINTTGLNPSPTGSEDANFRIAIPFGGAVSESFKISPDSIPQLNGLDAIGGQSVIRDFRSGNPSDAQVGSLQDREAPQLIADLGMGITSADLATGIITLNKRLNLVPIRGRIPFVDGGIRSNTGQPGGSNTVPTVDQNGIPFPLPVGDVLMQAVVSPTGELFTFRAEIIENLEVGTAISGSRVLGRTASGDDGASLLTARIRVRTPPKLDSQGNQVWFKASNLPGGEGCTMRVNYYEHMNYGASIGAGEVSDSANRFLFVSFDPPPPLVDGSGQPLPMDGRQRMVDPMASVSLRFSEPMDLASVAPLDNYLLSQEEAHVGNIVAVMENAKSAGLNVVLSRLLDLAGDGTELRLSPPLGSFHVSGNAESYWLHMLLGDTGIVDLSGNKVEILDLRVPGVINVEGESVLVPLESFSVPFELDPDAADNLVASRIQRFAALDEDGTQPGAVDYFGQFQLGGGQLSSAPTTRNSKTADGANLPGITRFLTGQCVDNESEANPNTFPIISPFSVLELPQGLLYQTPNVISTQTTMAIPASFASNSGLFGGLTEPHTDRGSRMQITYREDDFGLSYHQAEDLNLDIEQMHWAPWNDGTVLFDQFDRYSISLAHSKKRPDIEHEGSPIFRPGGPNPLPGGPPILPGIVSDTCFLDPFTTNSGLSLTFADNVLDADGPVDVVLDQVYVINPNEAFRALSGTKYLPFPKFNKTYTWRDSRHVSWDPDTNQPIGLGGAVDAVSLLTAGGDHTASVSSPWSSDDIGDVLNPQEVIISNGTNFTGIAPGMQPTPPYFTRELGDFLGDRNLDHDPIALPLLVDISVFPEDSTQVATGGNRMHMAHVGPPWSSTAAPGGYYNLGFISPGLSGWVAPNFRIHSTGGFDPLSGTQRPVQPDQETIAAGGSLKDMGLGDAQLGLFQAPPGDSNLPWAQIDLVRRVSLVTFGFFDTKLPNQHDLSLLQSSFPGLPAREGRPNLEPLGNQLGISEFLVVMDPPAVKQPGGTKIMVELRGAETIPNPRLYNPGSGASATNRPNFRGNLLNPPFACEAYRYAGPILGVEAFGAWDYAANPEVFGRPKATGLTRYVGEGNLDSIRNAQGLLPRYINLRLIMENNIQAQPALSPAIRSLGVAYRLDNPK